MKRLFVLTLICCLALSMSACGCMGQETGNTDPTGAGVIAPQVETNTLGAQQWATFQQAVTKDSDADPEEIANALLGAVADKLSGSVTPLEKDAEFFTGFDNYRITGYESGAVYMPMIGSIPFVGYVFELNKAAEAADFIQKLQDHCNPAWNVCVRADQTVAGAIGDRVFFLMCPQTLE